jgi:hypothetical protein
MREDYESTDLEGAARMARDLAGPYDDDRPTRADVEDDDPCSHCNGEGLCWDGSDPLGDCPDEMHDCHACRGSGRGRDQVIW